MFTPLILFLGLTVATAVIAHWSDNLGKKLGKKRVSLFGLRPRTTATVLTIASSWAIMLFTLVVLLAAVAPLRNALFSYDHEREVARGDREKADAQIAVTRGRLDATQGQYDKAKAQLDTAKADLQKASTAVKKAQQVGKKAVESGKKRAEVANQAAARAVAAEGIAQNRVAVAQGRLATAQSRLTTAKNGEAAALGNERAAQRETRVATRETRIARFQTKRAQQLTQKVNKELRDSTAKLKTVKFNLKTTQINLQTTRANKEKAKALLIQSYKNVLEIDKQLVVLQRQRNALQDLAAQTAQFVGSEAPVKVGQTFAAGIIAANQAPQTVAAQLRVLVRQGQEAFSKDQDDAPKFPAGAALQLLPLSDQDASGKTVLLADDAIVRRFALDIAQRREPTSVRLEAPRNYLSTETRIEAVLRVVPVKPAFAAGETLASATIDGTSGDAPIFHYLFELTDFGRTLAEKKGVKPPESPDEPNFYAEGTIVRLFEALRTLQARKARLRVNLVAAKALSTVEPLQVRFEIEGATNMPTS